MWVRLLTILLFILPRFALAQQEKEQYLLQNVARAENDSSRILALNNLAEYYYLFKLDKKADSVLNSELIIAELSNNKNLVFQVLFSNVVNNIGAWTSAESFSRTAAFLEKGLNYAKESGNLQYQAIAYIRKASLYRKKKEYEKAMEQATLAFSTATGNSPDSLKCTLYIELGEIFFGKGDAVAAYRNYNTAFDLAYDLKNIQLQSEIYHRYAALYQSLGNIDLAKESLLKSVELNTKNNYEPGLTRDYIDLARITDEKEYILKALALAQKIRSDVYTILSKRVIHAFIMVKDKDKDAALSYLVANPDLRQYYINMGMSNYNWNIGNIYKYSDMPDSALFYYNKAEPEFRQLFDKANLQLIYKDMAECYEAINQTDSAIRLHERSFALGKQLNNLKENYLTSIALSQLYAKAGDFKKAYEYSRQHLTYQDTLQKMAAQRDVALLGMERERRKHEKDLEELARVELNNRNLQYMAISIAIVILFFFLIILGAFPISKFTIRLLGYFSFICLFEFIVLLLDNYFHRVTHGEPLKIWIMKIFLIALLVPCQHFMEHGLIRFLQSQKLMKIRSQLSVKKWWTNMKKPAPALDTGIEEDTAIL